MKLRKMAVVGFAFLMTIATAAQSGESASLTGTVTQNKVPAQNVQLILTRPEIGRQYKTRADKKGQYAIVGVIIGPYKIAVLSPGGDLLYTKDSHLVNGGTLDIDLANPQASGGSAAPAAGRSSLAQNEAAKLEAAAIARLNALVVQAQTALREQKWSEAETALKELLEIYPETTRWEFFKALGDSQGHLQKYAEAVKTYDRGIELAHAIASGSPPPDPRNPNPDPARAALGASQMLISEGNTFLALNQFDEAVTRFKKASEMAVNPGPAYYSLCSAYFDNNKMVEAAAACEKASAADLKNADAWFRKGVAIFKSGAADKPASSARETAADALNNYLKLDPQGVHSAEARLILQKLSAN